MACVSCKGDTVDNPWGPWCDACGGVSFKPGQLFFRHVATVDGPGGRFPIVYDVSTSDYAYILKDPNPDVDKIDGDGFHRPSAQVVHGSLDAVIAISYPDVRGGGPDQPSLFPSPASTPEERQLMGV